MHGLCILCALLLTIQYGHPQTIHQSPRFASPPAGEPVEMTCSVKGYDNPYMYWYRKFPDKPFEMLFLSRTTNMLDNSAEKHFKAERPGAQEFILRTESVLQSDTAVYFCAWSTGGSSQQYFGRGTQLTVLEDGLNVTQPSLVLFDPSPQELREKGKATLVCLATNFYPDHVTLRWSVNGVETTIGVKTDESPTRGSDMMYSLSSRLRLTKKHWMSPHNTFSCSVYFDPENITISKETKGREGCGVTADSFRTSANTARLTYLLLMSKSALYGILVTLLVLKRKSTN